MVSKVEGAGSFIVGLISLLGEWLCAVYVNMCVEGSKREAGAHKWEGVCVLREIEEAKWPGSLFDLQYLIILIFLILLNVHFADISKARKKQKAKEKAASPFSWLLFPSQCAFFPFFC